jgi:hypothetical protein
MGADLCLTWVAWGTKRKLNWDAGHKVIDGLETNKDGYITCEGGANLERDDLTKELLHGELMSVEEATNGNLRDATVLNFGSINLCITGGVSWGDSPGETYDSINMFNSDFRDVLDAVGLDLGEDLLDYRGILEKILRNKAVLPLLIGIDKNLDGMLEKKLRRKAR